MKQMEKMALSTVMFVAIALVVIVVIGIGFFAISANHLTTISEVSSANTSSDTRESNNESQNSASPITSSLATTSAIQAKYPFKQLDRQLN